MTIKVHISPTPQQIADDNGIGRIVHAMYRYLPQFGIELVAPDQADVIACHIEKGGLPRVDVLHVHGAYFEDIPHAPYAAWHHEANMRIAASAREARAITVPSDWVSTVFKRDMRIQPHIIGHGIDLDEWQPVEQQAGYVLWNKNRPSDVCSPDPAIALANAGIPVVSTFGPKNLSMLKVIGTQGHETMRELIRHASVYLATTPETFGIGTLEAMAAGVPILGYDWCGTADLVRNGVDGILVTPGDETALIAAYAKLTPDMGRNARERAQQFGWHAIMQQYADLYHHIAEERQRRERVAVVITNYNYGRYLHGAIESLQAQTVAADEIIIVDDGSSDNSADVLDYIERAENSSQVHIIRRDNNQGVASARNEGIAATQCDFIVCLDADDELAPEYLEVCANALRADRFLGIAYTGLGFLQENGVVQPTTFPPAFDWDRQTEPTNPPATTIPTAAMFRRSMWERAGGYKQVYAPGEDAEFYTRGLSVGFSARKVAIEPFIHYRAHEGSASRTKRYERVDTWHPWMRDGQYPFAAPITKPVPVRSYARPVVSVIIPVGPGHAQYLPAALDSLLGQDFRQWEVIVVHDVDNDMLASEHISLEAYPFINWQFTPGNIGPSAARNIGLDASRAPLSLFLDADDWLLPGTLRAMVDAYVSNDAGYVYGDALAYGDGEPELLRAPEYRQDGWWHEGASGIPLMHHSVTALVPTDAAREVGFDETLQGWEEQFFFAELATRGVCGVRVSQPLIGYRLASGTVRQASFNQHERLHALRRERFHSFITGEEKPMGCCSGRGVDYDLAQQALNEIQWTGGDVPEGYTLVRYMGRATGVTTYTMVNGVPLKGRYTFAATEEHHIQPVLNEDVDRLLTYNGTFERYDAPPPPKAEPIKAAAPTVATKKQDEQPLAEQPQLAHEGAIGIEVEKGEANTPHPTPQTRTPRGKK